MLVFYLVSIVVSQESVIFYVICRIYRNVNNFLETFQSSHDPLLFWIFFFFYIKHLHGTKNSTVARQIY